MANTPDLSRARIFDHTKRYMGCTYQQGTSVFDWDESETTDELVWHILASWGGLIGSDTNAIFPLRDLSSALVPTQGVPGDPTAQVNNFQFLWESLVLCSGRPVYFDSSAWAYDESALAGYANPVNYIHKGTVTGITVNGVGTDYDVIDSEKIFQSDLPLADCRIVFTSGALDGSVFDIDSRVGDTTLNVQDDLSTLAVDDTYVVYPPALNLPDSNDFYFVTWFENISSLEDTSLEDPTLNEEPSQRRKLRWCVYPDPPALSEKLDYDEFFTDTAMMGPIAVVDSANTTVESADLSPQNNTFEDQTGSYQVLLPFDSIKDEILDYRDTKVRHAAVQNRTALSWYFDDFAHTIGGPGGPTIGPASAGIAVRSGDIVFPDGVDNIISVPNQVFDNTVVPFQYANTTASVVVSDDGTLTFLTSSVINSDHLGLYTSYWNVSNTANNAMGLGYVPFKQGLDIKFEAQNSLVVDPGQLNLGGVILQSLDRVVLDPTNASSWIGSVPVSSTWFYVYAFRSTSGRRDLSFYLTDDPPNWCGQHQGQIDPSGLSELSVQCIGVLWYDTSSHPEQYVRNDKLWFREGLEFYSDNSQNNGPQAAAPQPPPQCSNMVVSTINAPNDATKNLNISIDWDGTAWLYSHDEPGHTYQTTHQISCPGSTGASFRVTHAYAVGAPATNLRLYYQMIEWDFSFMRGSYDWQV